VEAQVRERLVVAGVQHPSDPFHHGTRRAVEILLAPEELRAGRGERGGHPPVE
jgi:hypothetical protein